MKNVGFSILVLPVLAVLVGVEVGVESKSSSPMVKAAQDFLEALDSALHIFWLVCLCSLLELLQLRSIT